MEWGELSRSEVSKMILVSMEELTISVFVLMKTRVVPVHRDDVGFTFLNGILQSYTG